MLGGQYCNTGRCLHGANEDGICLKGLANDHVMVHRCWTCLAAHPGAACAMSARHPLDQRCPCPVPCPPFMCIRGDSWIFRDCVVPPLPPSGGAAAPRGTAAILTLPTGIVDDGETFQADCFLDSDNFLGD